MNDQLTQELARVARRYQRLVRLSALAVLWLTLALMGAALLALHRGLIARDSLWFLLLAPLLIPLAAAPLLIVRLKTIRNPLWLAHRIERQFPDLDTRLLASLEPPANDAPENGFLRQSLIHQTVDHARTHAWQKVVPQNRLLLAGLAHAFTLLLFLAAFLGLLNDLRLGGTVSFSPSAAPLVDNAVELKIFPEDTALERNTALLVSARFNTPRLPAEVQLLYKDAQGGAQELSMNKALDDPLFAVRVPAVKQDMEYAVRYDNAQSRWFKVSVFDYPELKQADAHLKFPDYTALPEKNIEDVRTITAMEGTKATLAFRLNKPVASARLVPVDRPAQTMPATRPASQPVTLTANPADPTLYSLSIDLKQSQVFKLQLVDAEGRANKTPAELTLHVTPNKPPEIKVAFPGHDVDVSPIEELTVRGQVRANFGVKRVGIAYALAGEDPTDVLLGENLKGSDRHDISSLIPFEKLHAQPDQLLSYYLWAEDTGPDGKIRRTASDMFFAEVRPFEQIFRQGQQPAAGEEDQPQPQPRDPQQAGQQQPGGQAQRAEQLAEQQKQIIAATWKVMRRETSQTPSDQFSPDVKLLQESQAAAKEQASGIAEAAEDPRSKAQMDEVTRQMDRAIQQLTSARETSAATPLTAALSAEQAAYQNLLKLRARDSQVVRANRQQGQQSQSSAAQRRQQQLNQLDLDNEENRYQNQRQANARQQTPQQEAQARETRQVLSRLRELAQRQEDLNRQMQDLQSSLQRARDQAQREELERQLARLRDQQQQMLRDTDELQNRMQQPENQERLADAQQQLQQTRQNVQQASEQLQQGQVPQAAAAGQRASEQLNNLRDQVRRDAAGQFADDMTRMREDARALDQNQQALSRQMTTLDQDAATQPAGLRDGDSQQQRNQQREQIARNLQQERQDLDKLLDNMRQTVEQAETPEPLLSRQLYDTIRQTRQARTPETLDTTRQLIQQGLLPQARQAQTEAGRGITRVRQGIEQAAQSVLGDDTQALRRAQNQLDALSTQLTREMEQNARTTPDTQPATQRSLAGRGAVTQPSTQPGARQLAQNNSATQPQVLTGQPGSTQQTAQAQTSNGPQERQLASAGQPQNPTQQASQSTNQQREQPGRQIGQPNERQLASAQQPDAQRRQQTDAQPGERQLATQNQSQENQPGQQPRRGQPQEGQPTQQPGRSQQPSQPQQGQQAGRGQQGQPQESQQGQAGRGQTARGQENQQGQQPGRDQQENLPQEGQQAARGRQGRGQQGQPQQGQPAGRGQGDRGQPQGQQAQAGRGQQGQQPGRGQSGRPGQQPQEANAQPQQGQPAEQLGLGQGRRGDQPSQADRGGRGQPSNNQPPEDQEAQGQPQEAQQNNPQPGGQGGAGGAIARGGTSAGAPRQTNPSAAGPRLAQNSPSATRPRNAATQPTTQTAAVPLGGPIEPAGGTPDQRDFRNPSPNDSQPIIGNAPITGDGFREWSDRMRDVEEMVGDPQLRAQAARIRERLAAARADFTRRAQDPNWNTVNETISRPLTELRQAISQELLRRQSAEARVPIDKEPVPPQFADEVRRYYERLGSGK